MNVNVIKTTKFWLIIFLIYFWIITFYGAYNLPYGFEWSEPPHFQMAEYLYVNKNIPKVGEDYKYIFKDPYLINRIGQYASFSPLPYILHSITFSFYKLNPEKYIFFARIGSIIWYSGILIIIYLSVKLITSNFIIIIGTIALLAFNISFQYSSSYVNSDAMTVFFSQIIVYLILYFTLKKNELTFKHTAMLGLLLSVIMLLKPYAYFIYPILLIFYFINKKKFGSSKIFIANLTIFIFISILPITLWYYRNIKIYGEPFAAKANSDYIKSVKTIVSSKIVNGLPTVKKKIFGISIVNYKFNELFNFWEIRQALVREYFTRRIWAYEYFFKHQYTIRNYIIIILLTMIGLMKYLFLIKKNLADTSYPERIMFYISTLSVGAILLNLVCGKILFNNFYHGHYLFIISLQINYLIFFGVIHSLEWKKIGNYLAAGFIIYLILVNVAYNYIFLFHYDALKKFDYAFLKIFLYF